jgi:hypothetical protein
LHLEALRLQRLGIIEFGVGLERLPGRDEGLQGQVAWDALAGAKLHERLRDRLGAAVGAAGLDGADGGAHLVVAVCRPPNLHERAQVVEARLIPEDDPADGLAVLVKHNLGLHASRGGGELIEERHEGSPTFRPRPYRRSLKAPYLPPRPSSTKICNKSITVS